jgi:O-antigen/teichoic acid export membrane protein
MKADAAEIGNPQLAQRGKALSAVAARVLDTSRRFPSASQGIISIFDQALVSGTSFLTAAIVGRCASPDQLGLYYLVLSAVLLVSGFHEQVISAPYMVLSKRRHGRELAEYGGSIWQYHFILTVVAAGALAVAIILCSATGNRTILPALWALLGAGPLLLLRDGIRRFTFGNLQAKSVIALDATVAVVQVGGLALLGYTGRLSLLSIFGVMAGACALACFGWYLLSPPRVQFNRKRFIVDWRHNWAFGKWALCSYVVGGTASYIMLWTLGLLFGPSATALLGACTTLVGVTNIVLCGVGNVLTPLSARAFNTGGASELRRILVRAAAFLTIVIGCCCLFVLATGSWLVVSVFGPHYRGSGPILLALALAALMNAQILITGNGLWAIHRPGFAFVGDVLGTSATLIAATLLIRPYGALGAAMSLFIGAFTSAQVRTILLVRYLADASDSHSVVQAVYCPEGTYP